MTTGTSSALIQRGGSLIHPATGEQVDLGGPSEDLARFLFETRELESLLREAKGIVAQHLNERLDRDALWTQRFGEYEVQGTSPAPKTEYDGATLAAVLDSLMDEDLISREAALQALETVVDFKPRKRGINQLLKRGGKVEEQVKACEQEVEPGPRRVTVRKP